MKINTSIMAKRFEQLLILVAHLALLKWILHTLAEGGAMPTKILVAHFLGLSISGGLLIFGTAKITKRRHLLELGQKY